MKWTSLSLAFLALCCAVIRADDVTFTQGLSLEDMHRAGLDKLTPQEREALDLLVAGKKTVVREIIRTVSVDSSSPSGITSSTSSTSSISPASDPTPAAVAARATQSTSAADAGGWLHWLHSTPADKAKAKKADADDSSQVMIRTTLVGKFKGWGKTSVFHLANGQAWVVSDYSERQFIDATENPDVTITSAGIFGFILQMPGNDEVYIRVRPAN